jgi:cell division protein FtsB
MKSLKAEVVQLRRDNKEMVAELKELKENPAYDVAEIRNMKTGLLTLEKSKHDEIELKQEEKKRRFAAEESLKALRYSFTHSLTHSYSLTHSLTLTHSLLLTHSGVAFHSY